MAERISALEQLIQRLRTRFSALVSILVRLFGELRRHSGYSAEPVEHRQARFERGTSDAAADIASSQPDAILQVDSEDL